MADGVAGGLLKVQPTQQVVRRAGVGALSGVNKALRYMARVPQGERWAATPWKGVRQFGRLALNPYLGRYGWAPKLGVTGYAYGPELLEGYHSAQAGLSDLGANLQALGRDSGVGALGDAGTTVNQASQSPWGMLKLLTGASDGKQPLLIPEVRRFTTNRMYDGLRNYVGELGHFPDQHREHLFRLRGPVLPEVLRKVGPTAARIMPEHVYGNAVSEYAYDGWNKLPAELRAQLTAQVAQTAQ